MAPRSRRRVLGGIALVALAGCTDSDDGDGESGDGDAGDGDGDDEDDEGDVRWTGPSIGDQELSNAFPVRLDDAETGEEVVNVHYHGDGEANWHYQPLEVPLDATRQLTIRLMDTEDESLSLDGYTIEATVGDAERLEAGIQGDQLALTGRASGDVELTLTFRNGGASWTTPPLRVTIED